MGTMFSDWTEADVIRHNQRIKSQTIKNTPLKEKSIVDKPRAKYGNTKTEFNGVKYDSKKEAKRAEQLELQQRLGLISDLERQVKFVLQPSFEFAGHKIREIAYVADFVYIENGNKVVEDVKSPASKTPLYKLKKKMMMYVHGIEVKEV